MTRRELLAALPLTAAGMRRTPVYAHLWLYASRAPQYNPAPIISDIFADLEKAGLDGLEVMHQVILEDASFAKLPELSRRHRLPVIGTSWSIAAWNSAEHARIVEDGRKLCSRLGSLKAHALGLSVGDARRTKTAAELDAQAAVLRKLIPMAADQGVTINLHNHTYEVADGEYDLKETLARVPEAKLGPDIGWLFRAKIDPLDFIRRHRERIVYFHIRNEKTDGKWPEDLTEGVIDFAAIGKLLHSIQYRGDIAIELAHERDFQPQRSNGENFRRSRDYVRRVMRY